MLITQYKIEKEIKRFYKMYQILRVLLNSLKKKMKLEKLVLFFFHSQ